MRTQPMKNPRRCWRGAAFCLLLLLGAAQAFPQESTRADENRELREKKSAQTLPDTTPTGEKLFFWLEDHHVPELLRGQGASWKGIRPRFGGLPTGGGFGLGLQYERAGLWGDRAVFSASGVTSFRLYQSYEARLDFPELGAHSFASASLGYRNLPQEDFFGLGPHSGRGDRTDFLYEDGTVELTGGVRPRPWLRLGGQAAWLRVNVGPGTDARFSNTEIRFDETAAPGLTRQPNFLRTGFFAEVDRRDAPGNPRAGGVYRVEFSDYQDRSLGAFGFRRFGAEVEQYVPFNAGQRVVAFRFRTSLDDAKQGQEVPFYFQNTLGGPDDLRGFQAYRFRDRNLMLFNVEYRWRVWSGLDLALFGDAGEVFHRRQDFDLGRLEADFGTGFRFHTAHNLICRVDVAHGREGTRLFIKLNHAF
jgi:hypothetical protein